MRIIEPMPPKYVTIADANFRAFLMEEIPAAFNNEEKMDANHVLVKRMMELSITAQNITSLQGIEFFTFITGLHCEKNQLTHLDLTDNVTLTRLWCSSNRLESLKIPQTAYLQTLNCSSNRLKELNVGENTSLKSLYCHRNALINLDLTGCFSLSRLSIRSGEVFEGVEQNPLLRLKINMALRGHEEIQMVKAERGASVNISTHRSDGSMVCADYDPLSGRCNA